MISPKDYVFFTMEKEYTTTLSTSSGFTLDLAMGGQLGNELHHVSECGIVKHLPKKLSYPKETAIDLQVGDKIYFHFHAVSEENRVRAIENDEKKLYMIQSDWFRRLGLFSHMPFRYQDQIRILNNRQMRSTYTKEDFKSMRFLIYGLWNEEDLFQRFPAQSEIKTFQKEKAARLAGIHLNNVHRKALLTINSKKFGK